MSEMESWQNSLDEEQELIDDGGGDKKARDAKKCVIKRKIQFKSYNNCLEATQFESKINYLEKTLTQIVLKKS